MLFMQLPARFWMNIAVAIVVGVVLGICLGLALIMTLEAPRVAAFVVAPTATFTASWTPLPSPTPSATSSLTPTATGTDAPAPTATFVATPTLIGFPRAGSITPLPSTGTPRPIAAHFLFGRPLAADAPAPSPDWVYLYGTTELGQYEVHHGVDFDRNPVGVPVYAVGDGTIVSAGDDRQPLCGAAGQSTCGRFLNFYGLVTVIRLDEAYQGRTLFALHGHMSRIDVQLGQQVKRGDPIGAVGMTGIAIGPHIQFEIRSGTNSYASTRNPMLWIEPLPGRGMLAGRYIDPAGKPVNGAIVDVYRAEEPAKFFRETETYGRDDQPDVHSDEEFGENWTVNDLPAGEYIVRIVGKRASVRVTVPEGGLAFAELRMAQ